MSNRSYRSYAIGLVFGVVLGYLLGYFRAHDFILDVAPRMTIDFTFIEALLNYSPNLTFLSDLAAFEGVLIGVAIPIALQVVTRTADRYRDPEITRFFTDEILYRLQYVFLLPNIAVAIFLRFLDLSNPWLWLIFIWLLIDIFIFYGFVRLVEAYVTNTDKLFLGKLRRNVEDFFQK